jgi:hypothetical protein
LPADWLLGFVRIQSQKLGAMRAALPQGPSEDAIKKHLEYVAELESLQERIESFSSFGALKQTDRAGTPPSWLAA